MRKSNTTIRSCSRLSQIGRCLLIVSLWQAPLPMVHAHGADIADSTDATAFVEHLAEFHTNVELNSHVDFGWHWHLVPPMEDHPGSDCPDGHHPCCPFHGRDTLLTMQSPVASLNVIFVDSVSSWLSVVTPPVNAAIGRPPAAPTAFLETYLGSVSLGTLLRVARC